MIVSRAQRTYHQNLQKSSNEKIMADPFTPILGSASELMMIQHFFIVFSFFHILSYNGLGLF